MAFPWLIVAGVAALTALVGVAWVASDLPDEPDDPGDDVEVRGQNTPIPVVYGLRKVTGIRVFTAAGGPGNQWLWMACVLCEGEVEAVEQVWIDGEPITAIGSRQFVHPSNAGLPLAPDVLAVVRAWRGHDDQPADAMLTGAPGWTAEHRLRGVCYLACRFRYARDVFRGAPKVEALVRGRKVADPRRPGDGPAWTDNAALIVRDWCLNARFGRGLPAAEIDDALFRAAANDCDRAEETYAARVSLGSPSSVTALSGLRQRLTWLGPAPANLRGLGGGRVYRQGGTRQRNRYWRVISTVRVESALAESGEEYDSLDERWHWERLAAETARTEMIVDPNPRSSSREFGWTTARTVWLGASGRYEINVVLDTGKPVLDNLRRLLRGCRGMLPWSGGRYGLIVERDRPPALDIGPDLITGRGVDVRGPRLRDLSNRTVAKYASPERGWKPDSVIWPEPGSAAAAAMLAADGQRLETTVDLPTVTRRAQAADLARIVTLRKRGALRSRFSALPECLTVTPGDIVRVSDATLGWTNKPQLVLGVAERPDGELAFEAVDHDAAVYGWEDADPPALHLDTEHPNPLIVSPPADVAAEVVLERVRKDPDDRASPVIAVHIGAVVSWTEPADATAARYEAAYRSKAAGAAGWSLRAVPAGTASADLLPLRHRETYEFRVRALNAYGAASPWSGIVEMLIDKDVAAPDPPSGLALEGGAGLLAVSWTPPDSIGFSHTLGELRRFEGDGETVAETVEGIHYGDSATLSALPEETRFAVRLASVDDAGNVSAWTAWVYAETLSSAAEDRPPNVLAGRTDPPGAMGQENDTWLKVVPVAGAPSVESVWKKLDGVWVRVSGNPDLAAWRRGSGPPITL
ncbi:MAG: hypothetical protein F4Y78_07550 [Candidatus Dadabacteria bacterium]|nr:hypothetical protein [Candidatus Dadabacteria bacterium]